MRYGSIKFLARKVRIKSIDRVGQKTVFKFYPSTTANLSHMTAILEKYDGSVTQQGVMNILFPFSDEEKTMFETISVLKELSSM